MKYLGLANNRLNGTLPSSWSTIDQVVHQLQSPLEMPDYRLWYCHVVAAEVHVLTMLSNPTTVLATCSHGLTLSSGLKSILGGTPKQ